tara:strand:- start:2419 stop:2949 length:531 start_codon:yes stop_codon:yes gene_type:complete
VLHRSLIGVSKRTRHLKGLGGGREHVASLDPPAQWSSGGVIWVGAPDRSAGPPGFLLSIVFDSYNSAGEFAHNGLFFGHFGVWTLSAEANMNISVGHVDTNRFAGAQSAICICKHAFEKFVVLVHFVQIIFAFLDGGLSPGLVGLGEELGEVDRPHNALSSSGGLAAVRAVRARTV